MAIAYRRGDSPRLKSIVFTDSDGHVAEWSGNDVLNISIKVLADINRLRDPIYRCLQGYSIEIPQGAFTTETYGRNLLPERIVTTIDTESIIETMTQLGYGLGAEEADALRKACRIVDAGGPFYDDGDDDD